MYDFGKLPPKLEAFLTATEIYDLEVPTPPLNSDLIEETAGRIRALSDASLILLMADANCYAIELGVSDKACVARIPRMVQKMVADPSSDYLRKANALLEKAGIYPERTISRLSPGWQAFLLLTTASAIEVEERRRDALRQ